VLQFNTKRRKEDTLLYSWGCEKLIVVKGLVAFATPSLEARYQVSVFEGVIGAKYSNPRCDQMVAKWTFGTSSNPDRLFHRGTRVCA
jgi:hypothetical protein